MRLSRTAINRQRRVAADELLYTLELLGEEMSGPPDQKGRAPSIPARMRGRVWVEDEQAERLCDVLGEIKQLGGSRSRGLGKVTISAIVDRSDLPEDPVDADHQLALGARKADFSATTAPEGSLVDRLARFNAVLLNYFDHYSYQQSSGGIYFSLDCVSDVIWDSQGLPVALAPEWFAGAKRVRSFALPRILSGFSGASGLMRAPQVAAGMGSVFVYYLEDATEQNLNSLLDMLKRAESNGLGRDRERGYGVIQICTPFHLEVNPR